MRPAKRKTRLAVFARRVGNLKNRSFLQLALQVFARGELNGLGGFDLDLGSGLWIDTGPGLAVDNLEGAKADELNLLGLLQANFDAFNDSINSAFCLRFACFFSERFLDCFDEFCFVHGNYD